MVGSRVFSTRIGLSETTLDWRTAKTGVSFNSCDLPVDVRNRCQQYVARSGLSFGAIDLVESNGNFYFLEINPNGEWGWLERPHGMPISSAICDLLLES